jgi:hypothetical protein
MNDQRLVREVILKYHRGEPLTAAEQAILDAEKAKLRPDRVWEMVRSKIEATQRSTVVRPWYFRWPAVTVGAAAVLVVAVFGVYDFAKPAARVAAALNVPSIWRVVGPGFLHQEPGKGNGEVADSAIGGQPNLFAVILPDGTKVTLSYASSIRYRDTLGHRKVVLSGHAYFDVAKSDHPFVVETGMTTVQVLGTRFDMLHYPDMADEVTLLDGKVQVLSGKFHVVLRPAQKAVIQEGGQTQIKEVRSPEESLAWMGDRRDIIFKDEELYTVIRRLAQYYQVPYDVDPKLRSGAPINIALYLRQPLRENVAQIAQALGNYAKIEVKKGRIEVTK